MHTSITTLKSLTTHNMKRMTAQQKYYGAKVIEIEGNVNISPFVFSHHLSVHESKSSGQNYCSPHILVLQFGICEATLHDYCYHSGHNGSGMRHKDIAASGFHWRGRPQWL